jgi:hypothetical protein
MLRTNTPYPKVVSHREQLAGAPRLEPSPEILDLCFFTHVGLYLGFFICFSCYRAFRRRLIVADAAVLLGGLGDTIQSVVLICGDAISRVSGGEVRITDRGHAPCNIKRSINRRGAVGQDMLCLIGSKKLVARMSGFFHLSGFCYSSGAPLSATSLGLFDD